MKKYNEFINEARTSAKEHPFLVSAKNGGNNTIKKYIKSGNIDMNMTNKDGRTALMLAVQGKFISVVKTLIEANVDVNKKDPDGRTALMMVSTLKILTLLLEAGADTNIQSNDGMTAIMQHVYTLKYDHNKLLLFLKMNIEFGLDLDIKSNNGLNFYDQLRKWIKEPNVVQDYMDENYPQYKEEYEMRENVAKYNL